MRDEALKTSSQRDEVGAVPAETGNPLVALGASGNGASAETEASAMPAVPAVSEVRAAIARSGTPEVWRSLEELADSPELRTLVGNEFPRYAPSEWEDDTSRRDFLKLAGASIGLAGLTACTRQPPERLVPYVEQPEHLIPGRPDFYTTVMTLSGFAIPLVAESHMGRPTKLTGNPDHPSSLGGSDVYAQAATLDLYDPDRSKRIERRGRPLSWEAFVAELRPQIQAWRALEGEGLRILTGTVTSPSLAHELDKLRAAFPRARWVQYEPVNDDQALLASRACFGTAVETVYDLTRAEVVLSLDSDFLTHGPGHLRYARDFAAGRSVRGGKRTMNRLYALETTPSATGVSADHHAAVSPAELGAFVATLATQLGVSGAQPGAALSARLETLLAALALDLGEHRGRSVVIPGRFAPPAVHVLAHALNETLGNVGVTVRYLEPVVVEPELQARALAELAAEMQAGQVAALFILGVNPVYQAPGDVDFAGALAKVTLSVHLGSHKDETALHCHWHIPQSHFLEGWGDARSFDGVASIVQPLIEPLYLSRTELELLSLLGGEPSSDYDLVRAYWQGERGLSSSAWRRALHDGFIAGTAAEPRAVSVAGGAVARASVELRAEGDEGITLVLRPDPTLYDGRFANNGWLQETPKPLTKVTWDLVVSVSAGTAERLGVRTEDLVRVRVGERSLEAPIWVHPGHPDGTASLTIGFGRTAAGRVGNGVGDNAQKLRGSEDGWAIGRAALEPVGATRTVASTQTHHNLDTQTEQVAKRHLIKSGTLADLIRDQHFTEHIGHPVPDISLIPDWKYEGHAWGMAIDLTTCTGCNACVVACTAENNVPVVGREQVIKGREMHWLRIDRYFEGDLEQPRIHHQPVMCQHCERAPCEIVCPVGATTHSFEGLNEMTYNRCIGTRYCSNNCPYKVRRFNFLRYNDNETPVLKLGRNPNVSVRSRGVMEKCTYCVQRINRVRIEAKREDRPIRDGEIKTACQEACPSSAIVFGDLNDPQSEVARWKAESFDYRLLDELATVPRTTYLAKIINPNPALYSGDGAHHEAGAPAAEGEQH
jgi:molybdopterin-containing oxidoreductase family iron-sulfur binding subunit